MRPPPAPSTLAMQCGSATSRVCDAAFRTWRAQPSAVCLCAPPGHCAAGEPRALWVLAERCSRGGVCRARAAGARPACLIAQGRGPRGRSAPRRARWQTLAVGGGGGETAAVQRNAWSCRAQRELSRSAPRRVGVREAEYRQRLRLREEGRATRAHRPWQQRSLAASYSVKSANDPRNPRQNVFYVPSRGCDGVTG